MYPANTICSRYHTSKEAYCVPCPTITLPKKYIVCPAYTICSHHYTTKEACFVSFLNNILPSLYYHSSIMCTLSTKYASIIILPKKHIVLQCTMPTQYAPKGDGRTCMPTYNRTLKHTCVKLNNRISPYGIS